MEWHPFFTTLAGAAATVLALLFVAVQLVGDRIGGDQRDRWWAIAFLTFYLFLTVFFVSLSKLIPLLRSHGRAVTTLVLVLIYIFRLASSSFLIWRGMFLRKGEQLWETLWNLAAPLVIYVLLGYDSLRVLFGNQSQLDELVAFLIAILFGLALKNSWDLIVEGTFRQTR